MGTDFLIYNTFRIENAVTEDEQLVINGMCAHYNVPNLNSEIVDESSFNYFFNLYNEGKIKPALNYNHTDTIIGGIDVIESRKDGLWMQAHLNGNVAICRDMIIPSVLSGDLDSFSTEGYIHGGTDGIVFNDDETYFVKDFLLTAVAVVPTPADYNAKFSIKNYLESNPNLLINNKKEEEIIKKSSTLLLL